MDKSAALNWLAKAKDDLAWTQANIREKVWYGACFTAQQAAEKALKAYLIAKGKKIAKIHDLGALRQLCKKSDEAFEELKVACATLTDYYAPARYPDIAQFITFSDRKANEALKLAQTVVRFVEQRI